MNIKSDAMPQGIVQKLVFGNKMIGSTLLIIGGCIGAGMLALPIVLGLYGLVPSLFIFMAAWAFMFISALMLLEVQSWYKGIKHSNFITMSSDILGKKAKTIVLVTFLFLFTSIMVAYLEKGGVVFNELILSSLVTLPNWISSLVLCLITYLILSSGMRAVDSVNRLGMVGLILTFVFLVLPLSFHVNTQNLAYNSYSGLLYTFPFLVIAFGFHNIIPSISEYLNSDYEKVSKAILLGSGGTLVINVIWVVAVIGSLPLLGEFGIVDSYTNNKMASEALAETTSLAFVPMLAIAFAFFGIFTSMLAQGISVVDFVADGLKVTSHSFKNMIAFGFMALCFIFTIVYPDIFFKALEYAGGIATMILFGIIPSLMVWRGRYILRRESNYKSPIGKIGLILMIFMSCSVIFVQIGSTMKWIDITPAILLK